jgi:hypothetical protein
MVFFNLRTPPLAFHIAPPPAGPVAEFPENVLLTSVSSRVELGKSKPKFTIAPPLMAAVFPEKVLFVTTVLPPGPPVRIAPPPNPVVERVVKFPTNVLFVTASEPEASQIAPPSPATAFEENVLFVTVIEELSLEMAPPLSRPVPVPAEFWENVLSVTVSVPLPAW